MRRRARREAEEACMAECRARVPGVRIHGASSFVEPDRFVVRVFLGERPRDELHYLLPPWAECWVFAVRAPAAVGYRHDATPEVHRLEGEAAEPYRPRLR